MIIASDKTKASEFVLVYSGSFFYKCGKNINQETVCDDATYTLETFTTQELIEARVSELGLTIKFVDEE
jgi:hypothetical protein